MAITVNDQRTLWPGYVYPSIWLPDTEWFRFAKFTQPGQDRTGSVSIMNPASGPGTAVNSDWIAVVNNTRNLGHRVVGYTHTSYASRSAVDVKAEIDKYFDWYGVDGAFIDEMSTDVSSMAYYRDLYAYTHNKPGSNLVVGNPGTAATTDWQIKGTRSADILVIFENTFAVYSGWTPPSWVYNYSANNFANLVHATTAADLNTAITRSNITNAGYRYITDDVMPNPWDTLGHWPIQATP